MYAFIYTKLISLQKFFPCERIFKEKKHWFSPFEDLSAFHQNFINYIYVQVRNTKKLIANKNQKQIITL